MIQKLPRKAPTTSGEEEERLSSLARTESYEAYRHLLGAIEQENFDSRLYLNLGLALEFNGDLDKSFLAYESAKKYSGGDSRINFLSLYNAARIQGQQGKVDEALRLYQGALEIQPDSIEVKTNIELLTAMKQGGGQGQGGQGDEGDKNPQEPNSQDDSENKQYQSGREQPRTFQSRELSEDDVRKILEEIKNQEQKIRAKEQKNAKERSRAKDW